MSEVHCQEAEKEKSSFHRYAVVNKKPKDTSFVITSRNMWFNFVIYTA